jgi:hypothetical protein
MIAAGIGILLVAYASVVSGISKIRAMNDTSVKPFSIWQSLSQPCSPNRVGSSSAGSKPVTGGTGFGLGVGGVGRSPAPTAPPTYPATPPPNTPVVSA